MLWNPHGYWVKITLDLGTTFGVPSLVGDNMLTVQLVLRIKNLDGSRGWQTLNSKGTLPDAVVGAGTWYLRWVEDGARFRTAIGTLSVPDAKHARDVAEVDLRQREISRREHASKMASLAVSSEPAARALASQFAAERTAQATVDAEEAAASARAKISDYVTKFMKSPGKKKPSSMRTYGNSFAHFLASCKRTFLDELKRNDILRLLEYLREEKGMEERSVDNVYGHVMVLLKWAALSATEHGHNQNLRMMAANAAASLSLQKEDKPNPAEDAVEVYTESELEKLFAVATDEEANMFRFFQMTGMRDGEVRHAEWNWINWETGTIRVQESRRFHWTPKSQSSCRTIPLPPALLTILKKLLAARTDKCGLIFPAAKCQPNPRFLDILQATAKRAQLDPTCFWLHKFRATYATQCLRSGVDLFTVKSWLGHSKKDMVTIGRYVDFLKGEEANKQMAKVQFAS